MTVRPTTDGGHRPAHGARGHRRGCRQPRQPQHTRLQAPAQGLYSNGRARSVGQLQVAAFRAPSGLGRAGNNLWIATQESGGAVLGSPGSGGRGTLSAGALEVSNVDAGEEMVSMIQHQRAFSANSKVIAAADELLSQLMQLKR